MTIEVTAIPELGPKFAEPFVDVDEERLEPSPHRFVHGGFEGTSARFAIYFPPREDWGGRLLQNPGANLDGPGNETMMMNTGLFGGLDFAFDAGAYLLSSVAYGGYNSEPDDPAYMRNACAAAAVQSKQIAAAIYGEPPHHSYIWGGSGGGIRVRDCIENIEGVWNGGVPYMTGPRMVDGLADVFAWSYSAQTNVRRYLGDRIELVIDSLEPGGSGNPFEGLDEDQAREVAALMRIGYPRGSEFLLREPTADVALWSWRATDFTAEFADYFSRFWTETGHAGHDRPDLVSRHVVEEKATITRVLRGADLADPDLITALVGDSGQYAAGAPVRLTMMGGDTPLAVVLDRPLNADCTGARITIGSGQAAGRTLWSMGGGGALVVASLTGTEDAVVGFTGVEPGDEITVDNRDFIAYGFFYRHWHNPVFEVDGAPMFPTATASVAELQAVPGVGDDRRGAYHGKVILIHHAQDPYVWPPAMIEYDKVVRARLGDRAADTYRFWWSDRAEHVFPPLKDEGPVPVHSTRLIDYTPINEQAIHDLIAWCEEGTPPADDVHFEVTPDSGVVLASTAAERKGIQPVVSATANGAVRADVRVGEPVILEVHGETPPGGGMIIAVEWDVLGNGDWPIRDDAIDGTETSLTSRTTYTFDTPGTYFPSARVSSHRQGDVNAERRRVPNIARVRVVVT